MTDQQSEIEEPRASSGAEVLAPDAVVPDGDQNPEPVSEIAEIESPGKIIRIGAMVKQLLDEVRNTELDESSRDQLRSIYENSIAQLKTALSPELGQELDSLVFEFDPGELPSASELRLAKAQLVGWLEGLFHGIQATLMAQQMSARQQLEGVRAQITEGAPNPSGVVPGGPGYL